MTWRIDRPCGCGCNEMAIGKAQTTDGRTIYPYVCISCGTVQKQYAPKKIAAPLDRTGQVQPVKTGTQRDPALFERVAKGARDRRCEVCGAGNAQRHHWAPRYLFGDEAERWPTAMLCQACHTRWHQVVTPRMGGK